MQVNIKEFIEQSGLEEPFYPGKKIVKLCPQPGEFKSHCVVYDWRDPKFIRIEIKAGLSGRDLAANDLIMYPVSFQAPSFIEIDVKSGEMRSVEKNSDEDEEEDEGSSGSKGKSGGGKRPAVKKKSLSNSILSFASAVQGALPEKGVVSQIMIMGKEIAKDAYESVINKFFIQVEHAKISATELMAAAGKLVTKFTPPAFLKPKGDEQKVYKYNREKNEVMFSGGLTPS
jgi:hypothetical protein